MDPNSLRNLRMDRRLHQRRGWIPDDELARELESLPDAASKILPEDDDKAPSPSEGADEA